MPQLGGTDHRDDIVGASAYIIGTPCMRCTKLLINAGIKRINYLGQYKNSRGKDYIEEIARGAEVELRRFDLDPMELFNQAIARLKEPGGVLANMPQTR